MFLKRGRALGSAALVLGLWGAACGARTGLYTSDAGPDAAPPTPCVVDLDCSTGDACAPAECREGVCSPLPAITCDDGNLCTEDRCDPSNAQCSFAPVTLDLDGDGHRSPRPGFAPGAPDACGDDCDDRSAAAHPGGLEACDGVDNDCNGVIDDGAAFGAVRAAVRVSSAVFDRASRGGLAFDGKNYGLTFAGHQPASATKSFFESLTRDAVSLVPEKAISDVNSDTWPGPLLHNGSYFASVWADARQDGNYEIYFNRYDSSGNKLGPDQRLTRARGFSLGPSIVWNGTESLVVWHDRRFSGGSTLGDSRLFGQRVAFDGTLVGDNIELTSGGTRAEGADIALGESRLGIASSSLLDTDVAHAVFMTTAQDFGSPSALVDLSPSSTQAESLVRDVHLAYVAKRFVVAWVRSRTNYAPSIYAAVVDEAGNVLVPERAITSGASHARDLSLVSLGDRLVLVWQDDQTGHYEIYQQTLNANLDLLTPRTRITNTSGDTDSPLAALGPNGDLGVLYDDTQSGTPQTYFTSMSCVMSGPVPPL